MKIIVLIKQVPDTYEERRLDPGTGFVDRAANEPVVDEINERAIEVALAYRDLHKGTEVVLLTMGPDTATSALRKGLSMGADSAVHVNDPALAGSDLGWTSTVLAAALAECGFDLVIAGCESTDGGGGVIPAMVAEHLNLPHLSYLDSIEISETTVTGERGSEYGTLGVEAPLPAVISVTERSAEARFPNFKGIMGAKRKPIAVFSLSDLNIDAAVSFTNWGRSLITATTERPARVAGTKIVDDGNAATELAEFLAAGRLI